MNKIFFVALQEYIRNVYKKSFLLVLLSVPIFIAFTIGLGLFLESLKDDPSPVGYVDHAGILPLEDSIADPRENWGEEYGKLVRFLPYDTETQAQQALVSKAIQAYYVIPGDYLETRKIILYSDGDHGQNAVRQFYDLIQLHLLDQLAPNIALRAAVGTEVSVRSVDGRRVIPQDGPSFGLLMPLFITMAFLYLLLMSSGYVMGSVSDEKENRTIEILITSIKPVELIAGKIFGVVAIGLTLLIAWSAVISAGILVARKMGVAWFNDLRLDWQIILATIVIALPAYVLATALMTAVGSIGSTTQEAQTISAMVIIPHLLPLYISWLFINEPHNILAVVLSLTPFTSLMTIGMRNLFSIVPAWQVAVSFMIQVITATIAVWVAGRAFHLGMLRYGQRLKLSKLLRKQV